MKYKFLELFFVLLVFCSTYSYASSTIAVIHSYERGSWTIEGTSGVKKAFAQSSLSVDLQEVIFDYTKYISSDEKVEKIQAVVSSIQKVKPAIIIIFDDEACDALMPALNNLNIPIVVTGINKSQKDIRWFLKDGDPKRNFTGIFERYPFEQSLKMLKTIKPEVTKISILTSQNSTSSIVTEQLKGKFESYRGSYLGIALDQVYFTSSWEKWKRAIKENNQPNKAFWILVPWNVNDNSGKEVDLRVIGDFYRMHSKVPEIGIVNINDKLGFVASFSVGAEDLGFQAAEVAVRILKNKAKSSEISFVDNNLVRFVINKQRADQLKIKIPDAFLDFARIEKKIPMNYFR